MIPFKSPFISIRMPSNLDLYYYYLEKMNQAFIDCDDFMLGVYQQYFECYANKVSPSSDNSSSACP